jgi:transposase
VFHWGLPMALWKEVLKARVVECVDQVCPKREQGLSTGEYIAIAAINRAIKATSKRSIWDWFSETALMRAIPHAGKTLLSSQRFWDHMDKLDEEKIHDIWQKIIEGVIKKEKIDLDSISYDGTNYYSFIDTFNSKCTIAKRGKNKQGRANLRQINYAIFCTADGQLPIFYDVYEGNRHDSKEFSQVFRKFSGFLGKFSDQEERKPDITVIFDKGNNSHDNFALIDELGLNFVGSIRLDELKHLATLSNTSERFVSQKGSRLVDTKSFRTSEKIYGKLRTVIITFNKKLFKTQLKTLEYDIKVALEKLEAIHISLIKRESGVHKKGKVSSVANITKKCNEILSRQHLKKIIKFEIGASPSGISRMNYSLDDEAFIVLKDTYIGKNIIITSRENWSDSEIILAYRSQYLVEDVFKQSKNREQGTWWPLCHWTDSKIKVHALYCSLALVIRAIAMRRVKKAGISISMMRLLKELHSIREVVNVYAGERKQKGERRISVLTKMTITQKTIIKALDLQKENLPV